ncbi:hypothetical protein [Mucilaginibacter flavidus]|uniref:hypothetical protein n=1 Tax=Mucilaginibacter flavidus TaxID=2949309 RepID=UPI0020923171|nr:hypothetical protein [Mucilaginibacter flavidus]MCO5948297.1 hypothetical protein [Mucilaginibacter flavidus]
MKKAIILSALALTLCGIKAKAQTGEQAETPVKNGNEWQMPKDVLMRSKKFADGLKQSLGLDDATTKKVFNAYLGNTKSVDEIKVAQVSEKEKKDKLAANQQEFLKILQGILTPAQYDAYLKQKKQ